MFEKEIEQMSQEEIYARLAEVKDDDRLWPRYMHLFDKDFINSGNLTQITHLTTTLRVGLPLQINGTRYQNMGDRQGEQVSVIQDFYLAVEAIVSNRGGVDVGIFSETLHQRILQTDIYDDLSSFYIFYACIFVFYVMKFRCLFVAIFTELLVLSGFVYSMIIYREIFQIPYYQTWNTLIMFIVISTSTNNIFFFYDQWNASGGIDSIRESPQQRLYFASGRTLRVNAAASFLICSIYYSMYFAPLVAIKSLVVWAATVILINSLTQFLFFPCILLMNEKHIKNSWFDR